MNPINPLFVFRVYGKKVLKYVPVVGWAWNMSDVIFLDRNWEKVLLSPFGLLIVRKIFLNYRKVRL